MKLKNGDASNVSIIDRGEDIRFEIDEGENPMYFDVAKKRISSLRLTNAVKGETATVTMTKGRFNDKLSMSMEVPHTTASELISSATMAKLLYDRRLFSMRNFKPITLGVAMGVVALYMMSVFIYANKIGVSYATSQPQSSSQNDVSAEEWSPN